MKKALIFLTLFFGTPLAYSESASKPDVLYITDVRPSDKISPFPYPDRAFNHNILFYLRTVEVQDDPRIDKKFVPPKVSFHLSKDDPPLYQIKEDGNLYFQDQAICRPVYHNYPPIDTYYFVQTTLSAEEIPFARKMFSTTHRGYALCPPAMLLFSVTNVHHRGFFDFRPYDSPEYSIMIGLNDFDGTWGRIDNILPDGKAIYVRFADDEYQHIHVMPNTVLSSKLARDFYKDFDARLQAFRKELLDENSQTSKELRFLFLIDDEKVAEQMRQTRNLERPMREVEVDGKKIKQPYETFEVLIPEFRKYLENNYQKIRTTILEYLTSGKTDATFWADFSGRMNDPEVLYRMNFHLKEIDTLATIVMGKDYIRFDHEITRPWLDDTKDREKRIKLMLNYLKRFNQMGWFRQSRAIGEYWYPGYMLGNKGSYFTARYFTGRYFTSNQEQPVLKEFPLEEELKIISSRTLPEHRYLPRTKEELDKIQIKLPEHKDD